MLLVFCLFGPEAFYSFRVEMKIKRSNIFCTKKIIETDLNNESKSVKELSICLKNI